MSVPLLSDTPVADPFSGIDVSIPWVWGTLFVVLAVVAFCLWQASRNSYDDRLAWNYGVAMIATGIASAVALLLAVNQFFTSLGPFGELALGGVIVIALIALGNRGRSYPR
jgi:tryptophan-rich sensory protein